MLLFSIYLYRSHKFFIILILLTKLIAQENKQDRNIHIWNRFEKPSIENNYQYNKIQFRQNNNYNIDR